MNLFARFHRVSEDIWLIDFRIPAEDQRSFRFSFRISVQELGGESESVDVSVLDVEILDAC